MARVRFFTDFNYTPSEDSRVSILYRAGKTYPNVRREAVIQAEAQGKGREIKTGRRRGA